MFGLFNKKEEPKSRFRIVATKVGDPISFTANVLGESISNYFIEIKASYSWKSVALRTVRSSTLDEYFYEFIWDLDIPNISSLNVFKKALKITEAHGSFDFEIERAKHMSLLRLEYQLTFNTVEEAKEAIDKVVKSEQKLKDIKDKLDLDSRLRELEKQKTSVYYNGD